MEHPLLCGVKGDLWFVLCGVTGYRWDGVDRSNGWEKQLFLKMNERHAQSNDAYAWSVEDM